MVYNLNEKLVQLAKSVDLDLQLHRLPRLRTKLREFVVGTTAACMMDMGFVGYVDGDEALDLKCHWARVMIVGELKDSPKADNRSGSWIYVARYTREILVAQGDHWFVLGFMLRSFLMKLWAFDRLGGIASERFDVSQNSLKLITVVLGFLMMDNAQLEYNLPYRCKIWDIAVYRGTSRRPNRANHSGSIDISLTLHSWASNNLLESTPRWG